MIARTNRPEIIHFKEFDDIALQTFYPICPWQWFMLLLSDLNYQWLSMPLLPDNLVPIPVFDGDKKSYQNWKAAFTACVNNAPATPEYPFHSFHRSYPIIPGSAQSCQLTLSETDDVY